MQHVFTSKIDNYQKVHLLIIMYACNGGGNVVSDFISGALGALIGAAISFLSLRYNYKDLYARSISTSRMDWINNFREEVAIIIATLRTFSSKNTTGKNADNYIFEAEKARGKLLTRLNMNTSKIGNEYNKVMADVLNSIDFCNMPANSDALAETIIDLSRKILEPEWKRVKREAGGKKE